MQQHFVTFLSPGSFFSEETTEPIDSWDVKLASQMAHDVVERYGATPYGFYFTTRARGEKDLDSKQTKKSGMYFLGGDVETLEQIKARKDPNDSILISNMRGNNWSRVVTNRNSYRITLPLEDGDVILPWKKKGK